MNSSAYLLTGIPRSGTTLCCNLLNQVTNTVALHEPIDPRKLTKQQPVEALQEIALHIQQIRQALLSGEKFEHGDKSNLKLDNPVGMQTLDSGLRALSARRGLMQIPKQPEDVCLIIKQNALFAALSDVLVNEFSMVAIVRNPISVLLSWMTVDLPVNQGQLPAGQKYDSKLNMQLSSGSILDKQIAIYRWFITRFSLPNLKVLRYEDIISESGMPLYKAFNCTVSSIKPLSFQNRAYPEQIVQELLDNKHQVIQQLASRWYDEQCIEKALCAVAQNVVSSKRLW